MTEVKEVKEKGKREKARRLIGAALLAGVVVMAGGCIWKKANPAATQPATEIDPKLASASYWLAQPGVASTSARDFTGLWETCEAVSHDYLYKIDRRDYRAGLLITEPMVSKQWFEPWRKDAGTARDVEENSLSTIRRTIYFEFRQDADGGWTVTPKVLVERQSKVDPKYRVSESDLPVIYWYSLRRDKVMEQQVADAVRVKLAAGKVSEPTTLPTPESPKREMDMTR